MVTNTTLVKERRRDSKYESFKTNFPKQLAEANNLVGGEKLEWSQYGADFLIRVKK